MALLRGADGRLRPTLRVALYLPAFVLVTLVLGVAATLAVQPALLGAGGAEGVSTVGPAGLVLGMVSAGAAAVSTWLFRRFVDHRPWVGLGLERPAGWLGELGVGFGLGAALMAGIAALEIGLGWYRLDGLAPPAPATRDLLLGLVVFALVAFGEELVTRGYILQTLAEGWGRRWAVGISSLVFGLLHLGNPASGFVPILGIFFAGLLLAAGYLATTRLWLPIGLHWSWNYFQGPVFGFSVSGTQASGLLRLTPVGPEPLTGGAFGPEASVVGIGACIVGSVALLARRQGGRAVGR
jgi:membrane protease YdiL (CAAX protease family)